MTTKAAYAERACSYCGLPVVGGSRRQRPTDDTGPTLPIYCCLGCRFAASIAQEKAETGQARWTITCLGLAIFFSMNVMVFTLALWSWDVYDFAQTEAASKLRELLRFASLMFTAPVVVLLVGPLVESAFASLKQLRITSDLLLLAGVVASFVYSVLSLIRNDQHVYFEVTCMILVAVTLGRWLEATGKLKASQALQSLQRLLPETARHLGTGREIVIPLDDVQVSDLLRVLPGERIPVDGVIERQSATIDEQIVTGESQPVFKQPGDTAYGGTLNLECELVLRVTATAKEGTIQRLIEAVNDAAASKGHEQRLADALASWFVPAVSVIALATLASHWYHADFRTGLMSSLSVVLIACPCALGIATPLAVWAALAQRREIKCFSETEKRSAGWRGFARSVLTKRARLPAET